MTRIDKYLEKYLDGSISPAEIEEFRELLASDSRLERELAETLELRSILHDDLLEIEPPAELSARVESFVGEQFAKLAEVSETEEDDDDRAGILPWFISGRMAGSMAVAAIALLMVALAPTVSYQNGSPADRIAPVGVGEIASIDIDVNEIAGSEERGAVEISSENLTSLSGESGISMPTSSETVIDGEELIASSSQTLLNSSTNGSSAPNSELISSSDPTEMVSSDDSRTAIDSREAYLAENTIRDLQRMLNTPTPLERTMADDRLVALPRSDGRLDLESRDRINPSIADLAGGDRSIPQGLSLTLGGSSQSDPLSSNQPSRRVIEEKRDDFQRLMIGGTLVSGVNNGGTNLSLEGSAFLALGLGEKSRVGLEGGSATFRYRRDVPVEIHTPSATFAARGVVNNDGEEEGDNHSVGAGGGPRTQGAEGGILNPGGTPVKGAEELDQPLSRDEERGPTRGRVLPGFDVSYGFQTYETEASMVYGLVFYDHTVTSLSDRLNLNGRIGVGGTDGGMVLSARAYAAISSHENIAWTLGLGGSMLHDFAGEIDFNAMYGLNAGVQFGF